MKHSAFALLVISVVSHAKMGGSPSGWSVNVCLNPGTNQTEFNVAKGVTSQLLLDAGVRLNWRSSDRDCAESGSGIQIRVSLDTPAEHQPGALGEAFPYEGSHIVVFYDRVQSNCRPSMRTILLGYVMAHEIVHMLQGVASHSPEGLMKAQWTAKDHVAMNHGTMRIAVSDIDLIRAGLERQRTVTQ